MFFRNAGNPRFVTVQIPGVAGNDVSDESKEQTGPTLLLLCLHFATRTARPWGAKTVVLLVSVHVFQSLKESEIVTIKVASIHMTFPFYLHYLHYIPLMSPCLPCLPLGTQGAILGRTSPWWIRSTQSYTTRKLTARLTAVTWQFGETTEFPTWLQRNDGGFWTS